MIALTAPHRWYGLTLGEVEEIAALAMDLGSRTRTAFRLGVLPTQLRAAEDGVAMAATVVTIRSALARVGR